MGRCLDQCCVTKVCIPGNGSGQSEEHKRLKYFVAGHPQILDLPVQLSGKPEYPLPSGDTVDVLFEHRRELIAVEVKSGLSPEADMVCGIFQCIKYRAVLEALQASRELPQNARGLLVLEGSLPKNLVSLKNMLGVEVHEKVIPE
jgi:hypothetical protein